MSGAPRATSRAAPRVGVALLLLLHAALALWGAARNSVTFDENFHLPAGVMIVARGDFWISPVNPPLVKALAALPALAAGARRPAAAALNDRDQAVVGESFMRVNAARYHRVFLAARGVTVLLSLALAWLVWSFARRLYGAAGGLLALAFYALAPEALAHAGLVTMDLATGLGFFAVIYALWGFVRSGRWSWWAGWALATGFTFLTRFSAVLLVPVLALLAAVAVSLRIARRPPQLWVGLLLLLPSTLALVNLGYLGQTSFRPLSEARFESRAFLALQREWPGLRLLLPDACVRGLDWQALESQEGATPTYLLGRIHDGPVRHYFPLALLFKWPLGFLGALAVRATTAAARPWSRRRAARAAFIGIPVAAPLLAGMFLVGLNAGIRYMFPLVPFLCVWLGGLLAPAARLAERGRLWRRRLAPLAVGLALGQGVETATAAPYYLSFFNRAAGGPGGGYRLLNDSNVDWGQGLIALRDEMRRLGIARIHLAYHGTADPAVYGIDYVPYLGGRLGRESEWLAVSSYYYVGLSQRMMTREGRTDFMRYDFGAFRDLQPVARPAGCMLLFRLPGRPSLAPPASATASRLRPFGGPGVRLRMCVAGQRFLPPRVGSPREDKAGPSD